MYDDKITWYLTDENFNSRTYQFFTRVIGCSDENTDYKTLEELNKYPLSRKQQESPIYSVEFNEEGRLVLSLDFYSGRFVPTSIALISIGADNKPFMIAKIVTSGRSGSTQVSASVSRIFDIPIPKFKVGDVYEYPSFETVYKRKSGTPIGEEKVIIGEHHHAVKTNGENDSYPSLYSGQDNFILSAKNALPSDIKDSVSYVYGERGVLDTDYTDLLGVKATQNSINITDRNISASVMADILADVLEVIIMANNKIQILGKNIPTYDKVIPVSDEKQYILMADSVDQSNNRKLEAIDTERLKSWILGKQSVTTEGTRITLNPTISVIKSPVNFTISPNGSNKLAIVANTKSVVSKGDKTNLDDNDITVTLTGASSDIQFSIHASSIRYFYFDGSTWEEYHDSFAYDTTYQLLSGEFKFDKLDVYNTISSKDYVASNSISTTSLKATGTSNLSNISGIDDADITMTNAKLKFGGSYISSDSSASFGNTGSTTRTEIAQNGTMTTDTLKVINSKFTNIEQIDKSGIVLKTGSTLNFGTSKINSDGSASFIGGKTTVKTSGVLSADNLEAGASKLNTIEELTKDQGITLNNGSLLKFKNSYISGTDGSASFVGGKTSINSSGALKTESLEANSSKFNTIGELTSTKGIILNSDSKLNFGTSYISGVNGSAGFINEATKIDSSGAISTSNIQALSIKNGSTGISMDKDANTVTVHGSLSSNGGSLTLGTLTITDWLKVGSGYIKNTDGNFNFYNSDWGWTNIQTSGVYIKP